MKQIRIENGIILYYGNRAGRVTKGCAVVDPMFQGPELEGFLRKQTSIQEIQWKDGIFDRLTAGAVKLTSLVLLAPDQLRWLRRSERAQTAQSL